MSTCVASVNDVAHCRLFCDKELENDFLFEAQFEMNDLSVLFSQSRGEVYEREGKTLNVKGKISKTNEQRVIDTKRVLLCHRPPL